MKALAGYLVGPAGFEPRPAHELVPPVPAASLRYYTGGSALGPATILWDTDYRIRGLALTGAPGSRVPAEARQDPAGRELLATALEFEHRWTLAPAGTSFQCRIWRALLRLPRGRVTSYADLAAAAGQPRAVRAAAGAVAANPVGVLIPCHRVVRRDGALGGYAWGAPLKRTLLERELGPDLPDAFGGEAPPINSGGPGVR